MPGSQRQMRPRFREVLTVGSSENLTFTAYPPSLTSRQEKVGVRGGLCRNPRRTLVPRLLPAEVRGPHQSCVWVPAPHVTAPERARLCFSLLHRLRWHPVPGLTTHLTFWLCSLPVTVICVYPGLIVPTRKGLRVASLSFWSTELSV